MKTNPELNCLDLIREVHNLKEMKLTVIRWILLIVVLLAGVHQIHAQDAYYVQHQVPTAIDRDQKSIFQFTVPGINTTDVQDAYLYYRTDGSSSFRQVPAFLSGNIFEASIEVTDLHVTSIEYYFEIEFNTRERLTHPDRQSGSATLTVNVIDKENSNQPESDTKGDISYTILSPEPGETLHQADVVIAITLFYEEGAVDTAGSSFRLELNGRDITDQANASDFFYTYAPDNLTFGQHTASLKLVEPDTARTIASWSFIVTGRNKERDTFEGNNSSFFPAGRLEMTARNQVLAGNVSDHLSGNIRLNGRKGNIRYSAYGLLTSQEDPRLQPQNRYGGELYVGKWLELQIGHIYPMLSDMTISGRRVEGINTELNLLKGAINLQFLHGRIRRDISNLYQPVQSQQVMSGETVVDTTYWLGYRSGGFGAYQQNVTGGRVGYERGNRFKIGVNLLKAQDDTTSLNNIRNYNSLLQHSPELIANLSEEEQNDLAANPGQLNTANGPSPKGNVVAGADIDINLDRSRIKFQANAAMSLVNENIAGGALTSERAEQLGFIFDPDKENILKRLSWLIIINENMAANPIRLGVKNGQIAGDLYLPKGIWATESELALNYFKNNFRIQYRRVGPNFDSFANSAIRQDIEGYTISDRMRFFDDQLYLTLGYENLEDNVTGYKEITTNTTTVRSNISWYPMQSGLPSLSLDLMKRSRENGVDLNNPFIAPSLEAAAVQNYTTVNGELVSTRLPLMRDSYQASASLSQQVNFLGLTHDLSVNYSIFRTVEELYAFGDEYSQNISLRVTNYFDRLPMKTNIGFNYNRTDIGKGLNSIQIGGLNLGGSVFLLDDKLNIDASVSLVRSSSEFMNLTIDENETPADFKDDYYKLDESSSSATGSDSYMVSTGVRYDINKSHAFLANMRLTNIISNQPGEQFPNDRILQARYVFRF